MAKSSDNSIDHEAGVALAWLLFVISLASSIILVPIMILAFALFNFTARIAEDLPSPSPIMDGGAGDDYVNEYKYIEPDSRSFEDIEIPN